MFAGFCDSAITSTMGVLTKFWLIYSGPCTAQADKIARSPGQRCSFTWARSLCSARHVGRSKVCISPPPLLSPQKTRM